MNPLINGEWKANMAMMTSLNHSGDWTIILLALLKLRVEIRNIGVASCEDFFYNDVKLTFK